MNGLLQNATVKATAQATGYTEDTVYKYLRDQEFVKEYEERRKQILNDSCRTLQAKMGRATDELINIIENKETKQQIKLNAIDMLFRHAYKQMEIVELIERIEALERGRECKEEWAGN